MNFHYRDGKIKIIAETLLARRDNETLVVANLKTINKCLTNLEQTNFLFLDFRKFD